MSINHRITVTVTIMKYILGYSVNINGTKEMSTITELILNYAINVTKFNIKISATEWKQMGNSDKNSLEKTMRQNDFQIVSPSYVAQQLAK